MVTSAVRYHVAGLAGDAEWLPADGADSESETFLVGRYVVKIRCTGTFLARLTGRILTDVHGALRGTGLAPEMVDLCWINDQLVSVHERVTAQHRPEPGEIGDALAQAHCRLAAVPPRWTYPWLGFYGEYAEFAAVTPAIEDDWLRQQALALLPAARRPAPAGPLQYIHRDLHASNVLGTAAGVCLIDWELAHTGLALDDAAMALCCLAVSWEPGERSAAAIEFLAGYRRRAGDDRIDLGHAGFRPAVALSGLRQGAAAWFDDEGICTGAYWPAVRARMLVARELLGT
jgi:Phosphotransferase enzyme family